MLKISMQMSSAIQYALQRLQFTCLDEWAGNNHSHRFQCGQGHVFRYTPTGLLSCPSCPRCREAERVLRLKHKVEQSGSEWLDEQWVSSTALHRFRCRHDPSHEWQRTYADALRSPGCSRCHVNTGRYRMAQDGLQRLQTCAHSRGGECLATVYLGSQHKYPFRCAQGHTWQSLATQVLRGSWCPKCQIESLRLGIENARQLAEQNHGRFLSDEYRNSRTIYDWICAKGHTWRASCGNVRTGSWCPVCANMARTRPGSAAWMRYRTHPLRDE